MRSASFAAFVAIAACASDSSPAGSTEPIDLGSLVALTGDLQGTGQDNNDAANLAVEQINAAGGVLGGRRLRLVVEDDKTTVDGAREGYTRLLENKVTAIVGPSSSAQVVGIADLIAVSGTLTIGRTSTSPLLSTIADNDFFFRMAPGDQFQARVLARLIKDAGVLKLCMAHREDTYGSRLADELERNLDPAIERIRAKYNPSSQDLSKVLASCAPYVCAAGDTSCDSSKVGLVMITFVTDGKAVLDGAASSWTASRQRFFFTDGARDTELLKLGLPSETLQGAIGTIPAGPDPAAPDGDRIAAYRAAYSTRYGNPPPAFSQNAFDAVYSIAAAIEIAGSTDRIAVRDALRKTSTPGGTAVSVGKWEEVRAAIKGGGAINLRGASGEIDFDDAGDVKPPYFYRVWRIDKGESVTDSIETVE